MGRQIAVVQGRYVAKILITPNKQKNSPDKTRTNVLTDAIFLLRKANYFFPALLFSSCVCMYPDDC